ncbi:hypothetical protein BH23ACT9_BH23ACT9_09350 [soil metagenome]
MSTVQTPSPQELRARIESILAELRMSREEADERAARGTLTGDEYWALQDIRATEFLLGHDGS